MCVGDQRIMGMSRRAVARKPKADTRLDELRQRVRETYSSPEMQEHVRQVLEDAGDLSEHNAEVFRKIDAGVYRREVAEDLYGPGFLEKLRGTGGEET
jgi:FixJ family two-component response regulator